MQCFREPVLANSGPDGFQIFIPNVQYFQGQYLQYVLSVFVLCMLMLFCEVCVGICDFPILVLKLGEFI